MPILPVNGSSNFGSNNFLCLPDMETPVLSAAELATIQARDRDLAKLDGGVGYHDTPSPIDVAALSLSRALPLALCLLLGIPHKGPKPPPCLLC